MNLLCHVNHLGRFLVCGSRCSTGRVRDTASHLPERFRLSLVVQSQTPGSHKCKSLWLLYTSVLCTATRWRGIADPILWTILKARLFSLHWYDLMTSVKMHIHVLIFGSSSDGVLWIVLVNPLNLIWSVLTNCCVIKTFHCCVWENLVVFSCNVINFFSSFHILGPPSTVSFGVLKFMEYWGIYDSNTMKK